ncbi:dickkopf-related protein 1b [Aplochiton taeniatus]
MYLLLTFWASSCTGSIIVNSNAIKNSPGTPNPGHPMGTILTDNIFDSGSQNLVIDSIQSLTCSSDEECGDHGYCFPSRGACLPCKRRRKRCGRDAMCCSGNQCRNGLCLPVELDMEQQFAVERVEPDVVAGGNSNANNQEEVNSTAEVFSIRPDLSHIAQPALAIKGQEGESCLRSAACSEGLCCARHFWSKICKPVLQEGQVCTKHRRKGPSGLELFQRCDCGNTLSCRTQRGEHTHPAGGHTARNLHTCQKH